MFCIENKKLLERIGLRIVQLSQSRGISTEKLAEEAQLSLSLLTAIEKGEVAVYIDDLTSIAASLDVSIAELLEGVDS